MRINGTITEEEYYANSRLAFATEDLQGIFTEDH